ncbi:MULTISPECIES: lytic transglycosylase domain-containing protein [Achromobacter]|jgi:soluble lytic murein transglycosylase|uniref:Transglycosylase SLT domain-containing protein n=1 Tax=Achromobacter denitrificans TaxID=32002 RepID=A0A3R9HTZ6_ACHDE|nr:MULTISPECIES: lytic transglycosylase domain-containing protein [Achromobacter]ASC64936.1 lytic transglycosylase [Achromobacter denitrificans]MDF3847790.1 transglycosylase SLT domain-containing protein [Achromobacter denitrificans]MDF3860570.1 transglycosylase SLT domain-containing protein [Achromobacter denitrificans]OLU08458.1 lytic transglycosylase [Achromobacter denitrificans]QKH43949.1 transglycosylase SLT domain-containing protein [Achromobacter denitrificans]
MTQTLQPGRYQKTERIAAEAGSGLRRWLPLVALFTAACAPVDAQQRSAAVNIQPQPAVQAAQPVISVPPAVLAGLPPTADTPALAAVVAAREAMNRKQWSVLGALVPQAKPDPLGMYPEYWLLRYQLWTPPATGRPTAALQQFINNNPDAYLADRLRADWLLAAARSGDFETVRKLAPVRNSNAQIECAILDGRHMTGQRATAAQAVAVFAPGGACWALYDQLVADGILGWEQLEPQLRDAIEANKTTDARKFAQYMFEPQDLKTYDQLMKDPMKWLTRQDRLPVGRNEKELVTIALARLARSDVSVADSYLRREWAKSAEWSKAMAKSNLAWVRGQYALVAALNLDSRADDWYHEAGHIRMTEYNAAWKVRAALRQPKIDWKWVIESIEQMPASQQADTSWVYWKARGQAARGNTEQAAAAYASIADRFDFYGQLAAEELGRRINVPPRPAPISDQEIAEARANPGLRRAVQLFRLGWRSEAVPEWNFSLRGMSDRQLLAAAELARAENIYDRVVNTSDRTEKEVDFSQRFIAPFEGRVTAKANAIALDPAWVYGLIRQESRFIMDARSHVGASGLMQLMPATAKWVAGKIGMSNFTPDSVNDFDTNTELGTNYLNMVLRDLNGSQMLASAGYNAGPRRPHNWRSTFSHPVEGAIFAETIPFNETRTYVKNVMSNSVYYAAMFSGQPQSLKERLGNVVPLGAESTSIP